MPSHIRIIGGQWKRSLLPVPDSDGLRPTPDRVRETLFNWLGQTLAGWRCLDLFAGTGALGFEAASRGAGKVVLIERQRAIARGLQESVRRLGADGVVEVVQADALVWLDQRPPVQQDLILLDPPFGAGLHAQALKAAVRWLAPDGLLYVEADFPVDDAWLTQHGIEGFAVIRAGRAGQVHHHLITASAPA